MLNKKRGQLDIIVIIILIIALAGIFLSEPQITGKVTKDTCFEGTEYGKCSAVKPKYCDNGALKPNCQKCGCPPDQVCIENGNCIPKCSDGTLFGKCSKTQPFYCFKGNLLENCFKCGCYEGGACQADGRCTGRRIRRCDDNTIYNRCSKDKPKYCQDGKLIDRCSLCGCPEAMLCKDDKCIEKEQEVIIERPSEVVSEEEEVSVPEEPVKEIKDLKWFLSWLCKVLKLKC